jgi:hypothetical protein
MLVSITFLHGQGFLTPVHSLSQPIITQEIRTSWVPLTHTCNPNYSGGRDQYNHILKPDQTNGLWDHSLKKTPHKKRMAEWPQFWKKEKKVKKEHTNQWAQLISRREAVGITPIPYTQKTLNVSCFPTVLHRFSQLSQGTFWQDKHP